MSIFGSIARVERDAIFELTAQFHKDTCRKKVNLGQGAYRDSHGNPFVLPSVRKAREILASSELQHEYLPIAGLAEFRAAASKLALGSEIYQSKADKTASCQSISGTGALHLVGRFLRDHTGLERNIYISDPSWSNHFGVFESLGYRCHSFSYYDSNAKRLDFDSYMTMLNHATPGSIVVLHACAHNPTGYDPSPSQWHEIGKLMKARRLFPLFDAAYLGFNSGSIDQDASAIRHFVDELNMEVAICVSFAKNMGLYGERVGCLVLVAHTEAAASNSESVLESIQRTEVSNPPAYGAKLASVILNDDILRKTWEEDLVAMSQRIMQMRRALYESLNASGATGTWDHVLQQSGMFGFLGLLPETVQKLKDEYHIYMAENSRISIAGLNPSNVRYVAESIAESLRC